ncbi:tRNA (adenosine(37)-N6)-threonylcarbamoyltransferase complex ATPase subunit type 1 TsaE [Salirhabdus sp. Marseille-P4669]|uniref:tRNA (adenosine(37)-N6)-threonylcarbamoyltransferase complex ATPase subunit type 1 TsaE n=1 Tax=Salirhabdus sp. Marseille-P4669 TaxID=2042310 RepID=UPI000C7A54ED|nr:tRNA (adenosine(37)-N6)-threonylcarbamoyltransferase complex ATPase subunit type 1 TsaE [Salirhabdus sp. Marseille-P4669]
MDPYIIHTNSPEETMAFAEKLATYLKPGNVLTLEGDLGAGKTTFTKGLAKGLKIKRTVNSPTFTIVKEYEGIYPLYHIDAYRLENSEEDIGFEDYFAGDGVTVVEWATYISDFLPDTLLNVSITYESENARKIQLMPQGTFFEAICKELIK